VPNADGRLKPGMFAEVSVYSGEIHRVLAIPATAVLFAPFGDSVFVIAEQEGQTVVHQRFVRLGERRGDFVAVTKGLSEGDEIVSAGAFKLRNGARVQVNNALASPAQLEPKPENR
jgi:membrane fusion protein (multidrug efflux system)